MKLKPKRLLALFLTVIAVSVLIIYVRWRPANRFESQVSLPGELRIVTWNVGYFALATNKNMKDLDITAVSDLLSEISANVIILQELGTTGQAGEIARHLGPDWNTHSAQTGHGAQVVSIITSLPINRKDTFECGGRMVVGTSLTYPESKQVYVIGIHAPHPGRGIQQNKDSILCAFEHGLGARDGIKIIAGDFNINFDSDGGNPSYQDILKNFGDSTVGIGETYYAHTRIDHIFHSPKTLKIVENKSGLVDISPRFAGVPGFRDHRPIVVTYDLR